MAQEGRACWGGEQAPVNHSEGRGGALLPPVQHLWLTPTLLSLLPLLSCSPQNGKLTKGSFDSDTWYLPR